MHAALFITGDQASESILSKCDKGNNRLNQSRITCFDVHGYPS